MSTMFYSMYTFNLKNVQYSIFKMPVYVASGGKLVKLYCKFENVMYFLIIEDKIVKLVIKLLKVFIPFNKILIN